MTSAVSKIGISAAPSARSPNASASNPPPSAPPVKRLESAGLVTRARNPDDERQVLVSLTPRGHEIRDECGCLGEELLARSGMTGEQMGKLNRKVQALRDAVAG